MRQFGEMAVIKVSKQIKGKLQNRCSIVYFPVDFQIDSVPICELIVYV